MNNEILNTCYISLSSAGGLKNIVQYSHAVPIVLSLILAFFVLFKSRFSFLAKIFLVFILSFSLWLLADLIAWISNNYDLVYSTWSLLVYIELIFYISGLYFALVFVKKNDISMFTKIGLFLISLPPLVITVMGDSVTGFYQPICEAGNNNFLDIYKLIVEIVLLLILLFYIIKPFIKRIPFKKQRANIIVLGSMFLFLSVFGVTEYISAMTGFYELNLYSLFLLPVFILVIIYAVFELDIFHVDVLGTQYLVVGLVILIVGQVFFVSGTADILLTIITIIISVALSVILFRNLKRESDQRLRIQDLSEQLENYNTRLENANGKLKGLDKLKTEFLSLASHQLRSPLTAMKGYTSMLLEGDYGEINPKARATIEKVMESSNNLTLVVEDLLNISKIEQGGMKYEMAKFDLGEIALGISRELSVTAEGKGLKLICNISEQNKYFINADKDKIRQVVINILDNAIKYTPTGQIEVDVNAINGKILLNIKDTGVGIKPEIIGDLFEKFSRGDGAKLDNSGSGLGLYLVKEIIQAHKGRVWVESEGLGKGSTFFVELDQVV